MPSKGRGTRVIKPEAAYDALLRQELIVVEGYEDHDPPLMPSGHFDLSALPEKQREEVLWRHYNMQRLDVYRSDGGKLSNSALDDFARRAHSDYVSDCRKQGREKPKRPMSAAALRRWHARWRDSGFNFLSLVQDHRGNSHGRLNPEQLEMLVAAIEGDYLHPSRKSAKKAHRLMVARINIENRAREASGLPLIDIPHYNTLLRRLKEVELFDQLKARYNVAYATKVTRQFGMTPPATRHLERVQMDHTLLDVYVDFGKNILVRPWITMILDVYTKAVLGIWITPEPASAESVMQALKMAALPKDVRALGGEPEWPWPMYGLPAELVVDNGKEFLGKDLEAALSQLGVSLVFTPPRMPWYKSQVERKFREVNNQLLSEFPGQVFKYEPEKHGRDYPHLTLEQLKRLMLQWVTTILHRTPNREGYTPEELWLDSVQKFGSPASGLSMDFIELTLSKGGIEKIIHPNGICHQNLTYNNEWLSRLRNRLAPGTADGKPRVQIKWSASDVGLIYVLDPGTMQFFPVRSKEAHAHGRSLYNHQIIQREQRLRREAKLGDHRYTDAELALNQALNEITGAMAPKKKKQASRIARFIDGQPQPTPRTPEPVPPTIYDPKEPMIEIGDDLVDTNTGEIISSPPSRIDVHPSEEPMDDLTADLEC